MANGDLASTLGWTTYAATQDRKLGYDNDNYALDRAAEQRITLRDTVLPAINQPIFAVKRTGNTADINLNNGTTYWASTGFWSAPILNTGFTSWSGGQLMVRTGGAYRLNAHLQIVGDRNAVDIFVVRNTTDTRFADKDVLMKNSGSGRAVTATDLVRLSAGDQLAVMVRMTGAATTVGANSYDLTFSAEWVRA